MSVDLSLSSMPLIFSVQLTIQGYTTDVCVPVSKLPESIVQTKQDGADSSIEGEHQEHNLCLA